MIDTVQSILAPIVADYLGFLLLALVGFFMRHLPSKWRLEVEQKHRLALHKALETGVNLAVDTLQRHPAVAVHDKAIAVVVDYVAGSVPDALQRLAPTQKQLEDMARAKIQAKLDAALGRDRLAEALQEAGA